MTLSVDALEGAEHELDLGIRVAEARTQRLMADLFANTRTATSGLRALIVNRGVEHAIRVITRGSFERLFWFGRTNDRWLSSRRHLARKALSELPEALRELQALNDRRRDIVRARHTDAQSRRPEPPRLQRRHRSRSR